MIKWLKRLFTRKRCGNCYYARASYCKRGIRFFENRNKYICVERVCKEVNKENHCKFWRAR